MGGERGGDPLSAGQACAVPAGPALFELRGVSKRYPAVKACDRVDLRVAPGEIHAVLGENGAGKSTLMKIAFGAVQPDEGEIFWDGRPVAIRSPQAARAMGIGMVFQHFSLFDTLTAAENVWLGLDRRSCGSLAEAAARTARVAQAYGLEVDPLKPVHLLSVGERQRLEIVRALMSQPRLLILDEPTSVLTPQAAQSLFATLRRLAAQGCSILYISHKLDEIRALCHRCTVLRAGRVTGVLDPSRETPASLSRLMLGAEPAPLSRRPSVPGAEVLGVRGLSLSSAHPFGTALRDVRFSLRAGEIVGLAGVSGNGQQELLAALSGEDRRSPRDAVHLAGRPAGHLGAAERRSLGLHFVPEERLGRGAVPSLSLAQNTLLTRAEAAGARTWVRPRALRGLALRLIERFQVKAGGPQAPAQSLSGGNLQKFIMGREIDAAPRVLIAAQPTWGVDVGAAAQIHGGLLALRDAGCAVLVVSEDLEELLRLSDRLIVIARGRVSPAVAVAEADAALLGPWMSGLWPGGPAQAGADGATAEVGHVQV